MTSRKITFLSFIGGVAVLALALAIMCAVAA